MTNAAAFWDFEESNELSSDDYDSVTKETATLLCKMRYANMSQNSTAAAAAAAAAAAEDAISNVSCYAADIYDYLREAEKRRFKLKFVSVQTESRPALLSLMRMAVDKWNLTNSTLHLAVYLLDVIMDVYGIVDDKLNLAALTSLMVAIKVEESRSGNKPNFYDLSQCFDCYDDFSQFQTFEVYILTTVRIDVTVPTMITFADYFVKHSVTLTDLEKPALEKLHTKEQFQYYLNKVLPTYQNYSELCESVKDFSIELANWCLLELKFMNVLPSLMAAACVATARRLHNLQPHWTAELEALTKYTFEAISTLADNIFEYYVSNVLEFIESPTVKQNNFEDNSIRVFDNVANEFEIKTVEIDNTASTVSYKPVGDWKMSAESEVTHRVVEIANSCPNDEVGLAEELLILKLDHQNRGTVEVIESSNSKQDMSKASSQTRVQYHHVAKKDSKDCYQFEIETDNDKPYHAQIKRKRLK